MRTKSQRRCASPRMTPLATPPTSFRQHPIHTAMPPRQRRPIALNRTTPLPGPNLALATRTTFPRTSLFTPTKTTKLQFSFVPNYKIPKLQNRSYKIPKLQNRSYKNPKITKNGHFFVICKKETAQNQFFVIVNVTKIRFLQKCRVWRSQLQKLNL